MFLQPFVQLQLHAAHRGGEVVAGIFHVCSHAEVALRLRLRQPVLALYVVRLLLLGVEGGADERQREAVIEYPLQRHRAEERAEEVALLTVKIHLEGFQVLLCAECRLPVLGVEVILRLRYVADEVQLPPLVGPPRQVCLPVNEARVILARGVKGLQQCLRLLVSHAVGPREFLVAEAQVCASSEQAGTHCGLRLLRTVVGYIEHRRHSVAVFRLIAAGREAQPLHHVGIDD